MSFVLGEGDAEFDLLHILQFDSTRKRMSVIVKHPTTKEIILLTKGADSQILSVLHKKYKGTCMWCGRYFSLVKTKCNTKIPVKLKRIKISKKKEMSVSRFTTFKYQFLSYPTVVFFLGWSGGELIQFIKM